MVTSDDVDIVYIGTITRLHKEHTLLAIAVGKHVLCEKPLALTASEAGELIQARDAAGVLIQEAFMVRYHPQWLRARDLVRSGKIGDLRSIQGFFSYNNRDPHNIRNIVDIGGGGLYDIGCYPITGARFLFEAEPSRVVSLIERDPEWGIDRLTSAILEFPGGHATFTCSTQITPYQRMQILGTEGRIEIEIPFNAPVNVPCRVFIDDGSILGNTGVRVEELPVTDQYTAQGEVISRAIRNAEPLEFPLENAVWGMRIIDAVFRSAESGGWEAV
jgi:predicted dehydrogenase